MDLGGPRWTCPEAIEAAFQMLPGGLDGMKERVCASSRPEAIEAAAQMLPGGLDGMKDGGCASSGPETLCAIRWIF